MPRQRKKTMVPRRLEMRTPRFYRVGRLTDAKLNAENQKAKRPPTVGAKLLLK
jgi:hypothetical protein